MKRRIIAGIICFLLLCAVSMYAGYYIDRLLSGHTGDLPFSPVVVLPGAWIGKARLMTLLLMTSSGCGVLFLLLMPEYIKYKSAMVEVVPGVRTPESAGQGQYGNAHWLPAAQIPKVFASTNIDATSPLMRELMEQGYDDLLQDHAPHRERSMN